MNFFGHAAVAAWRGEAPDVTLGSMLPDLALMCGGKPAVDEIEPDQATPAQVALRVGIALHHRTDAVFHAAPGFGSLLASASGTLRARGVERGPARAAAHVAIELFLDGGLIDDAAVQATYRAALAALARWSPEALFRFDGVAGPDRFHALHDRLRAGVIPAGYADASFVAARVAGLLSHRPRLALDEAGRRALGEWAPIGAAAVRDEAPVLLATVRAALCNGPPSTADDPEPGFERTTARG